ncbi:SUKH-3 domain-containing protein [Capnocytophaga sp.]|uniref:SUKH-3 domain-containing protein n=1 Tax=Capnocytophaga sp. TaxID=44737 RepID=UPI0026DB4353|nr:SUKH-3 domain-containing protein [Capnocytophaga sp.]MDO5106537.1 SUKH-3 domain-containing protein [Capnocytophaga sp.]
MARFTKKTYEKLTNAGWYHNRRVSIDDTLIKLSEINYEVNETIKDFLIEFDGINLEYSNGVQHFDFETRYTIYNIENFNLVNNLIGSHCLKVGAFCNNDLITAISENGEMFALMLGNYKAGGYRAFKIGEYIDEGIEFICHYGLNPYKHFDL